MTTPFPPQQPWQPHGYAYPAYPAPAAAPAMYGAPPAMPPAQPIALPEEAVPPGTRPWTVSAAYAWAAVRAPWWTAPFLALAVIVVGLVGCVAVPVESACDQGTGDCGPDWLAYVMIASIVLAVSSLFALPALVIVGAVVTAGFTLLIHPPAATDLGTNWPWWLLLAGLAWAIAISVLRIRRVRAQRGLASDAAGPLAHPLPDAAGLGHAQRALVRLVFGVATTVLAVLCVWGAIDAYADDRAHEKQARLVNAEVTDYDDDTTVTVRVDGERRERVSGVWDHDYDIGENVEVLVDGDWTRVADEDFDPFMWELSAISLAVPGLMLMTGAFRARNRTRRLRPGAGQVPTLRALVVFTDPETIAVFPADDTVRTSPLFHTKVAWWPTPWGAYPVSTSASTKIPTSAGEKTVGAEISDGQISDGQISDGRIADGHGRDADEDRAAVAVDLEKAPADAVPAPRAVPQQPWPQGAGQPSPWPQGAWQQGAGQQGPWQHGAAPQGPWPQGSWPQGHLPPSPWPYPGPWQQAPMAAYAPQWPPTAWMPRACEAVVYGAPHAGSEFVMLIARADDTPCVAVSQRAVRPKRIVKTPPPSGF